MRRGKRLGKGRLEESEKRKGENRKEKRRKDEKVEEDLAGIGKNEKRKI